MSKNTKFEVDIDLHSSGLRKPKKFRTQVVHQWITQHYKKCRVLDVGGGKGLLTYLLVQSGWEATLLDPEPTELPKKYTGLDKKKYKIKNQNCINILNKNFEKSDVLGFDLIVGLHSHGSNILIIEACEEYKKDFLLIPCCVIDEPIIKAEDINWRESLIDYAKQLGHEIKTIKFGFMGKDLGLFTDKYFIKGEE